MPILITDDNTELHQTAGIPNPDLHAMTKLKPDQITQLQHTLAIAREGRATLPQLASAHELAQGAGLPGCAAELRAHIRAVAADRDAPIAARPVHHDVALGVVSGLVTHALIKGIL